MVSSDTREEHIGSNQHSIQDSYATQEHDGMEEEGQSSDESSLLGNASWSDE